jgi:serine/threonine protein kinase
METRNQTHPTAQQLAAFVVGKLTPEGRVRMQAHLADCEACSAFLSKTPRDPFVNILRQAATAASDVDQSTPDVRNASTYSGLVSARSAPVRPAHCGNAPQEGSVNKPATPSQRVGSEKPIQPTLDDIPSALREQTKYRIERLLGRGGMGSVYEAHHARMDRRVAIKVINPSLIDHPEAVKRFDQEVRAAAKVEHENIARAYDADEIGSLRILVMEFISGQSLDKYLAKNGPLSVVQACRIIQQAFAGLNDAHKRGMVHRDLKPQNLMLTPEGKVKILDFGLAKLASEHRQGDNLTRENALMGTPHYLAPEQALDAAKADVRADIYSLGCTLYCLLAGVTPFQGDTDVQVLLAHQRDAHRPLCELRPDVPRGLSELVDRMLAKNPADRPQSPVEAGHALLPFIRGTPTAGTDAPASPGIAPLVPTSDVVLPLPLATGVDNRETGKRTRQSGILPRHEVPPYWGYTAWGAVAVLLLILIGWSTKILIGTPTGTIVIENVPPDAEVLVDGERVNIKRAGEKVTIDAVRQGERQIKLVRDGRPLWTNVVEIEFAGQQLMASYQSSLGRTLGQLPISETIKPLKLSGNVVGSESDANRDSGFAMIPRGEEGDSSVPHDKAVPVIPTTTIRSAEVISGNWVRNGDEIAQTSTRGRSLLMFGNPGWSNYTFNLKAMSEHGPEGFMILFAVLDDRNYRAFLVGGYGNTFSEVRTELDGAWDSNKRRGSSRGIQQKKWHDIRIEIRGATATCYLDGTRWYQNEDSRLVTGRVGLFTENTAARFKDFLITADDARTVLWQGLPRLADEADANSEKAAHSPVRQDEQAPYPGSMRPSPRKAEELTPVVEQGTVDESGTRDVPVAGEEEEGVKMHGELVLLFKGDELDLYVNGTLRTNMEPPRTVIRIPLDVVPGDKLVLRAISKYQFRGLRFAFVLDSDQPPIVWNLANVQVRETSRDAPVIWQAGRRNRAEEGTSDKAQDKLWSDNSLPADAPWIGLPKKSKYYDLVFTLPGGIEQNDN